MHNVLALKFDAAELFLYTLRSGVSLHTKEEEHNSAATSATFPPSLLGLILFPQQRHAAPLHDSSRFTLCPREKKDGESERPTCEKRKAQARSILLGR